jgi:hypothetical protein
MLTRTTMIAVAGVSAGAATVALAPAPAYAAPPSPAEIAAAHTPWQPAAVDGGPNTTLPVPRKHHARTVTAATAEPACNSVLRWGNANGEHLFTPIDDNGFVDCTLRLGDAGAPVAKVQDALRLCYGKDVATDGVWGDTTQSAVRDVRASKSLGNPQQYDGDLIAQGFLYPVYDGADAFTGRCDTPFA